MVRLLGAERGHGIQLVAFTPYVAGGALLPAVLALALRRRRAAVVALVTAIGLGAAVAPRAVGSVEAAAGRPVLRVLAANLLAGAADPAAVVDLVRRAEVDVLAVQELTPDAATSLDRHGLRALLPHRVLEPIVGTEGSGLYSRLPLRDTGVRRNGGGFRQAYGTLTPHGGAPVTVESVHPMAPASAWALPWWERDLAAQPPATPDGPVRVLAGDFNATLDHARLRRLLRTGYRDAADVVGAGLVGTWGPYDGDPIPPVTLDHVLADRRVRVLDFAVHPVPGSDHRAVLAVLAPPSD